MFCQVELIFELLDKNFEGESRIDKVFLNKNIYTISCHKNVNDQKTVARKV